MVQCKEPARWTGFQPLWFFKISSVKLWLWCLWELHCFKILEIDNNLMTSPLNHYTTLSTGFLAYNHSCPDSLPIPYPNFKQPVQHTEVPTHRSILDCGDQGPGLGSLGCHKPPHTEWLKQQRFIRSHSYRTDIQGQGVSKAVLPQQVLVENPFFASSCIW